MATLSKEQVRQIIQNAPQGTSPAGIVAALRQKGHQLEGFQEPQVEKDPGFLQSIAQGVASPFLKTVATALDFGKGVSALTRGAFAAPDERERIFQEYAQAAPTEINAGFFGKQQQIQTPGEAIGTGVELAANLLPFGKLGQAAKATLGGKILGGAKLGVTTGGTSGLLGGFGRGLQEGEGVGQAAVSGLQEGVIGAATGGVLGGALPVLPAGIKATKQFIQPERAVERLSNQYRTFIRLTPKQLQLEAKFTKNTPEFLAREGIVLNKVGNKLDPTDAIDSLTTKYQSENAVFNDLLQAEGKFVSLEDLRRRALNNVNTPFYRKKGSEYLKLKTKINEEFDAIKQIYSQPGFVNDKGEPIIDLLTLNQIKSGFWGRTKGFGSIDDAITGDANFILGHVAKELIENNVDDVGVKSLNTRLGDFITAIDVLEKSRGKAIPGGTFGKLTNRIIGGIAGSALGGPVGTIAGALTSDAIFEVLADPKISTAISRKIIERAKKEAPQALQEALERIELLGQQRAQRLQLPEPRPLGSPENPFLAPAPDVTVGPREIQKKNLKGISKELSPLAQEARKFKTAEEFVKAKTTRPDYGYGHSPNENGVRAFDLTEKVDGEQMIPKDMYERWYGSRGTPEDLESISVLKKVKGNPEAEVTIFRASPKDEWNYGDWITLSKKYAQTHAEGNNLKVFSKIVKAKDIRWAMDDINEFGYFPESTKSQLTDIWNKVNKK